MKKLVTYTLAVSTLLTSFAFARYEQGTGNGCRDVQYCTYEKITIPTGLGTTVNITYKRVCETKREC